MFNTYVKFGQIFVFDMQRLMACKWPDQMFNCHLESLVQIFVLISIIQQINADWYILTVVADFVELKHRGCLI